MNKSASAPAGKMTFDVARHDVPMRRWTVLAQDPQVLGRDGAALTTTVSVPAERLERGPKGHRVHVIDYDATANAYYRPRSTDLEQDHYAGVSDIEALVRDPRFHQQNVYAITMATLKVFEGALGRPVAWGFRDPSHQLKVAPHAFADANAYYSRDSESLNFGYFPDQRGRTVYTCLSHDIVVHEATHALLDGLRPSYLLPSSIDQAGFHEGFSDVIALLSVFAGKQIIEQLLQPLTERNGRILLNKLNAKAFAETGLAKLAEQMGAAMSGVPTDALRQSLKIQPDPGHYTSSRFQEEHDRGELLVAIVIGAFLQMWEQRMKPLKEGRPAGISKLVVTEEGANAAKHLLRILIRALDYMPPVDLTYPDYLSALLTADMQLYPDDGTYAYRESMRAAFKRYGVAPASHERSDGVWQPPNAAEFSLSGTHFERMQRDPTEVFRFLWENKKALNIEPSAFTRVTSVRPVLRVSNDQCVLRETVVEYVQQLNVYSNELGALGIRKPDGMRNQMIRLYGGGSLIFNEYGLLKFHIGTGVKSAKQSERLQSLWERGYFAPGANAGSMRIAYLHRDRVLRPIAAMKEAW